jgi:hypothetical protein
MNGMYPTFGNTGVLGGGIEPSLEYLESAGARQMTYWYNFFENTRHWELEPFFEVDGGRGLALAGVEYIVYVEEPGPVELITERQTYQVYWFNPVTGERTKEKRDYRGDRFSGQPPSAAHDWVLHLSQDNRKRDMAKRYYFESRRVPIQEIELAPSLIPYEIVAPESGSSLAAGTPVRFAAKLTRETRATGNMLFLWTTEVTGGREGYRVLGSGASGEFTVPAEIVSRLPANLNLRLLGMNALGKVYSVNRVFPLTQ